MNRTNLHPYQLDTVAEIVKRKKLALWLDMGLGKTVITLTALAQLKQAGEFRSALVVAPKTVAENVWKQEQEKWEHLSGLEVQLIIGTPSERAKALHTPADVYVISRDSLAWLFLQEFDSDFLIIDESTSIKDRSTQRWSAICQKSLTISGKKHKRARAMLDQFQRVLLLSGTPASESYAGLWAQIYTLDKGERLGTTLSQFRQRYMVAQVFHGYPVWTRMQPGAVDEINEKLADICISMKKEDYITLPERFDIIRPTGMSDASYWKMHNDSVITVDGVDIIAGNSLALYGKLQQICSGFIYDETGKAHTLNNQKETAFRELLEELDGNVLTFYRFDYERERLQKLGGVPLDNPQAIAEWNAGRIRLAIAHPASAGWGLNLAQGGSVVVWYSLPLSLEEYIQSNARIHRQGQQKRVTVVHLIGRKTIEEKVYKLLQSKADVLAGLLEYFKRK